MNSKNITLKNKTPLPKVMPFLRRGLLMLLLAGLVTACQPPSPTESLTTSDATETASTPIIISEDSVTMAPEYVLSIKPTRYQPSLGLQGHIEATKGAQLTAAQDLQIQKVLVTQGQWVEKGTPLFIVQRQTKETIQENELLDNATAAQEADNVAIDATNPTTVKAQSPNISTNNNQVQSSETKDNVNAGNVNASLEKATLPPTQEAASLITVRASFSGRVDDLYINNALPVQSGEPLLQLNDDRDLRFIATLPIQAESQLSIGQNVNFTASGLTDKFTGQVSKLTINPQTNKLLVYVHVVKNEASRGKLRSGMAVSGRVDYGQIEVGTIVPEHGIHDADLSELKKPPYKPVSALTANVWIIKQDQRLTRQAVEVIEYDPSTEQYLIAGVRNDSLVCLADLPLNSAGKKAVISS